jgi:hypothetical protein
MDRRVLVRGLVASPFVLGAAFPLLSPSAAPQLSCTTLAAFGHGTIKQNNRPALGVRPLLIVLAEYSNYPAFSASHPLDYHEKLGFGTPTPPFSTTNPVNPASLCEYFHENSYGRFSFARLGLIGPLNLGALDTDPGPEKRAANILQKAAGIMPQLFASADANSDGRVSFDEICIVVFENIPTLMPANRDNTPFTFTFRTMTSEQNITVQAHIAFAGPKTPFFSNRTRAFAFARHARHVQHGRRQQHAHADGRL